MTVLALKSKSLPWEHEIYYFGKWLYCLSENAASFYSVSGEVKVSGKVKNNFLKHYMH